MKQTFPAWFVGIVGGTGLLTALVPGSLIMLNASTTIARNIYREGFAPNATDREVTRVARIALPIFTLVVVYFVLRGGATFVTLAIFVEPAHATRADARVEFPEAAVRHARRRVRGHHRRRDRDRDDELLWRDARVAVPARVEYADVDQPQPSRLR